MWIEDFKCEWKTFFVCGVIWGASSCVIIAYYERTSVCNSEP
jgi:hypothetical protein